MPCGPSKHKSHKRRINLLILRCRNNQGIYRRGMNIAAYNGNMRRLAQSEKRRLEKHHPGLKLSLINQGAKVESEHRRTYHNLGSYVSKHHKMPPASTFYRGIASDHIKEDRRYYQKLRRCKL